MGAVLTKIEDPRDKLGKATRDELWAYAKASGIIPEMLSHLSTVGMTCDRGWQPRPPGFVATQLNVTSDDMASYLRGRGFINPQVAIRVMGAAVGYVDGQQQAPGPQPSAAPQQAPGPHVAATDKASFDAMSMNECRAECKARGIKMDRRDNLASLREKLKAA